MAEEYLLEVKHLKKVFSRKRSRVIAVDDINFKISSGQCFSLIGESGSGKSTAANMIAGLLDITEGEVIFNKKTLPDKSCQKGFYLRDEMQMVFQNPLSSFSPKMTVLYSICEGLRYRSHMTRSDMTHKAYETLEMVGLKKDYANRFCSELSGGECQRVAIARAIVSNPKLLICDEVTNALDVSVQAQVLQLLLRLKQDLNLSYLFISHDIALVSNISDRIAVMKEGNIVEEGVPEEIINHPKHPYTDILIRSAQMG
ncbi:oligopeptide transport ATP-binding protein OppF [Oxobacter pfennigii]|uniref:Oligopeptide transport ATP-binding protein OppF n=1 Tax=Oxobacter pfennigii TaxID=36849 RepID=A0A0N8NTC1_9CLOT|nr:ATP-binding cassette domain-containing protein [Oxobacter pfennigii]KPU44416.1 oligopeptide transport ATP-binding protein OppF [Oxobacter pfennigii]